jgi:hypothetical protein
MQPRQTQGPDKIPPHVRRAAVLCLMGGLAWAGMEARLFAQAVAQPSTAAPQAVAATPGSDTLSQPQLEQLLAPIALYPDSLLMQMLMAATYPLEIVQAKRWLGQGKNTALRGDELAQALVAQSWDPSVKSLVPFADVLGMMSDQLDWTQQLGDAVLAQQDDVMNAVQALRGRAQAAGQLRSGPQQTVTVVQNVAPAAATPTVRAPPQVITIEPARPEQVAVPVYNPSVVYGAWPYPAYPPAYYPPPPSYGLGDALLTGMAFAGGVAVVGSLWGWARPGWGGGNVDVDVNRYNNINVNRAQINNTQWQHDVSHRHGTAYQNQQVNDRFRGTQGGASQAGSREQFRGRVEQAERGGGLGDNNPGANQRRAANGPGVDSRGTRQEAGQLRPSGQAASTGDRRPAGAAPSQAGSGRPQTQAARQRGEGPRGLQNVGQNQGQRERAASARGQASRHGMAAARPQTPHRSEGGMGEARGGGGHGGRRP